jgi:hypothetical protein
VGNGICSTTSGVCTLRAAITEANRHSGPDTIAFAIPGSGVRTIQLNSRLPTLLDESGGTTINGYTQPGATPNTAGLVSNAQIRIEVRGKGMTNFDGLPITSAGNLVKGLAFYNLKISLWVYGAGAHDNIIAGNFVGTNATGTFGHSIAHPQAIGVKVEQGAAQNQIGGIWRAQRNVISGNARQGVGLWHWPTNENVVYNNLVGLSPDGTRRVANQLHGVDINFGASFNVVGGLANGQRNVVSGNALQGIEVTHGHNTVQNQVIGNYVGTDVTGNASALYTRNFGYGIQVKDRVKNNLVTHNVIANSEDGGLMLDNFGNCCLAGNRIEHNRIGIGVNGSNLGNLFFGIRAWAPATTIGPGNIIAYNPVGILIEREESDRNTITQNSIFQNTVLGIDLGPFNVINANDAGDVDTGPNQRLNFPILDSATVSSVTGRACAGCRVEIFYTQNATGLYGQGKTFVGAGVTAANGTFAVAVSGVLVGQNVTATATDAAGNTSEFSRNVRVAGSTAAVAAPDESPDELPDQAPGEHSFFLPYVQP